MTWQNQDEGSSPHTKGRRNVRPDNAISKLPTSPMENLTVKAPISHGGGCDRLEKALRDCHKRIPEGPARRSACRHLNRSLAECLVSISCPNEVEAVRILCSSGGTALKRSQCEQAKFSLSFCLSSLQD